MVWGCGGFPVEEDILVDGDVEALRWCVSRMSDRGGNMLRENMELGKMQDLGYLIRDMG